MTTPRFQGVRPISMSPNDLVYTAVWQSGSSQIIMRDFHRPTMKAAPFGDYEPDYGKGEMAKMGMEAPIVQNLGEERSTINMDVGSPRRTYVQFISFFIRKTFLVKVFVIFEIGVGHVMLTVVSKWIPKLLFTHHNYLRCWGLPVQAYLLGPML